MSETTITLDETGDELHISEFRTSDPDITRYFQEMDDAERAEKLETALRVGVLALRSSETVEDVDYVEKRFSELQQRFNDQLDDLLGENGTLVSDVFDPTNGDTPLGELRQTFDDEMEKLRRELDVAAKEEEMVESTRLKGEQFEDDLYDLLADIAATTGDKVEQTGATPGLLGESKKGDFVIDLNDMPAKIAVEAKDTYYTQPEIEAEMEEAIENRGAAYGLFVARSTDNVPNHVGWFNEYNQNQLVVVLSDEDESMADELLRVAYKWARMRVLEQEAPTSDDFDATAIQEEVAAAERTLKSFKTIKKKCTSIEDAADDIRAEAEGIQADLEKHLDSITTELTKARTDEV